MPACSDFCFARVINNKKQSTGSRHGLDSPTKAFNLIISQTPFSKGSQKDFDESVKKRNLLITYLENAKHI
jgi:hypothetical protein